MAKTTTPKEEKPKFKFKLPKALAACADRLYIVKQERLAKQKEFENAIEALRAEETALTNHLIDNIPKGEATGVVGKVAKCTIVTKPVPVMNDWDAFWASFDKKRDRDLLPKSINAAAVKERWEAKKSVPGVGVFNAISVSLNKVA